MVTTMTLPTGAVVKVESPNAVVQGTFSIHGKTVVNPTLFVPFLRLTGAMEEGTADRQEWDHTWDRTIVKRNEVCVTGNDQRCRTYEVILDGLTKGVIPFARFTNMSDGRWWGKFYDASVDTVTIRPSPTDKLISLISTSSSATLQGVFGDVGSWISDTVSDIGSAIVEFANQAWDILEDGIEAAWEFLKDVLAALLDICDLLKKYLPPGEKKDVALAALSVVAPGVGSTVAGAIALAEKICNAIAVIAFATQGPLPPPPLNPQGRQDAEDEDKFIRMVTTVMEVRPPIEPEPERVVYPPGSFGVYNPHTQRYHILVNLT